MYSNDKKCEEYFNISRFYSNRKKNNDFID